MTKIIQWKYLNIIKRNIYKRRSLQRSLPVSWLRDETFTERESEFLKSINMDESIPTAATLPISIPIIIHESLKSVYRCGSSLVNSLPERYCYNKRFSSYDTPTSSMITNPIAYQFHSQRQLKEEGLRRSINDLRKRFRSRSSEPTLMNYDCDPYCGVCNQTIVISNNSHNTSNQIILKSSFSDQNLLPNINTDRNNFNYSVKYNDEPRAIENKIYSSARENSSSVRRRRLPNVPNAPRNTQSMYLASFQTIPSIDSEKSYPLSPSRFGKSFSADLPDRSGNNCQLSQNYLKSDTEALRRSYSLIADEQIIEVEYDNDMGWVAKNVRQNPFKKYEIVANQRRERSYSRENLKLNLKYENKPKIPIRDAENAKIVVDPIGSIIDSVRSKLLLSQDDSFNLQYDDERRSSLKIELEGKVVTPKVSLEKYTCEKAIGFEKENQCLFEKEDASKKSTAQAAADDDDDMFKKCNSRSSVGTNDSKSDIVRDNGENDNEEVVDDVFEAPHKRERNASFSDKDRDKRRANSASKHKRSSSLEGRSSKTNFRKSSSGSKSIRNSSVSINENPKNFEHKIPSNETKSSKIASSHTIAKLRTKPTRGSFKQKTSTSSSSSSPATQKSKKSSTSRSSDYDSSRRSRNPDGGHRDSFKNNRTNERSSEQDRDGLDQKDGNLNRSLSNTDTNLEDRIGDAIIKIN